MRSAAPCGERPTGTRPERARVRRTADAVTPKAAGALALALTDLPGLSIGMATAFTILGLMRGTLL